MPTVGRSLAVVLLTLAAAVAGCRGVPASSEETAFEARADARRFEIAGKIVAVDKAGRQLTVAHEEVKGFMDAMTMPFTIKERWALDTAAPGDLVRGTLVVDGARSWIEGVSVTRGDRSAAPSVAKGSWSPAEPGTAAPDVALVDQDAEPLSLDRFKGQPLLVTFSYTRCPLPEYCPLMMQRVAALEKATAARPSLKGVRLLTVTLDPEHDTPARLKEYGAKYAVGTGADRFGRWTLATGKPEEVKKLAAFLGLDYYTESTGQVIHSLRTAVLDGDGKLVKVFESNEWKIDEVLRALEGARSPVS